MDRSIVERIKKLFALASNNPNSHEAELASAKAQELMMKHNIKQLTEEESSINEKLAILLSRSSIESICASEILKNHYLVEVLWQPKKGYLFYGTNDNIEVAQYVYHFLVATFRALWKEYQQMSDAPRRDRKPYIFGLMKGLNKALNDNKEKFKQEYGLVPTNGAVRAYIQANVKFSTRNSSIAGSRDAKDHGFERGKHIKIAPGISHKSEHSGKVLA